MNIRTISTGAVISMTLLSGSLWAAQEYSEEQIRASLKAYADQLPEGHKLNFEGLNYDMAGDLLTFEKVDYTWPSSEDASQQFPAGSAVMTGVEISDPNLQAFLDIYPSGVQDLAKFIKWRQLDYRHENGSMDLSGTDGVLDNLQADLTSKDGQSTPLKAIAESLGASSFSWDRVRYNIAFPDPNGRIIRNSGTIQKLLAKGIASNSFEQFQTGEISFKINSFASDGRAFNLDGEISSVTLEDSQGPLLAPAKFPVQKDYSDLWQGRTDLYELFTSFAMDPYGEIKGEFSYGLVQLSDMKLTVNDPENQPEKVKIRITDISMRDATRKSLGEFVIKDITIKPDGEPGIGRLDLVRMADIDLTSFSDFFEELRAGGAIEFDRRLAEEGFTSILPNTRLGEFAIEGFYLETPEGIHSISRLALFDLFKNDNGDISLGLELSDVRIPAEDMGHGGPEFIELLRKAGHDALTVSALVDLDHTAADKMLKINNLTFDTQELGGASLSGIINNFTLPKSDSAAAMTAMFSEIGTAQLKIIDKGFVELVAREALPAQPGRSPSSLEQLQQILAIMADQSSSQARVDFFKALGGLATSSGELLLVAKPAKPIAIAEIVMTSNQGGPEAVLDLLNVESTHKK